MQKLSFGSLIGVYGGTYSILCRVPRANGSYRSSIVSYEVDENN